LDAKTKTPVKMKIAIAATLIASATAFAPVAQKASSSALSMSFENEIGAQPPLGFCLAVALIEGGYAARKDEIEEAQIRASGWDQETLDKKLAIELNQGRAAQMGILALMVHEKLDNNPYIINDLLGYPVPFNQ